MTTPDERRVEFKLRRIQRELDHLDPQTRQHEVVRIRLQILRNAISLVRVDEPARAVLLEQVDDLAISCEVQLSGGGR